MIHIHATKKLYRKFGLDENGHLKQFAGEPKHSEKVVDINPLQNWHANSLTIQRRNCVMLVHDQTRFTVFIPCLLKKNFDHFQTEFEYAFMNTLLKCGGNEQQMEMAHSLLERIAIDTDCNRSVQGTQNQMIQTVQHLIYYDDIDITEITGHRVGAYLADTPCTAKGRTETLWPKRDMLTLLSSIQLKD